jgi:hypothetical protein
MPKKKIVLRSDGSMKTVVKAEVSQKARVAQHRHGRGTAKFSEPPPDDVSTIKYVGYLLLWSCLIAGVLWVLWWVY